MGAGKSLSGIAARPAKHKNLVMVHLECLERGHLGQTVFPGLMAAPALGLAAMTSPSATVAVLGRPVFFRVVAGEPALPPTNGLPRGLILWFFCRKSKFYQGFGRLKGWIKLASPAPDQIIIDAGASGANAGRVFAQTKVTDVLDANRPLFALFEVNCLGPLIANLIVGTAGKKALRSAGFVDVIFTFFRFGSDRVAVQKAAAANPVFAVNGRRAVNKP